MGRHYTVRQRREALERLVANEGNFHETARDTGISVRTLRRWQRLAHDAQLRPAQRLERLENLMGQSAITLAENLLKDKQSAPLNQRASALGMLVDRLLKLDEWQRNYGGATDEDGLPDEIIRLVFVDPDGSEHRRPQWERDKEAASDD